MDLTTVAQCVGILTGITIASIAAYNFFEKRCKQKKTIKITPKPPLNPFALPLQKSPTHLLLENKRITDKEIIDKVIFNAYSSKNEPYYLLRSIDEDIEGTLQFSSLWISGICTAYL